MTIHQLDIRVPRTSQQKRIEKAAKASLRFIRRQAEARRPENKEQLARCMWRLYFRLRTAGLLAAPKTTRRLLRAEIGFWKPLVARTAA